MPEPIYEPLDAFGDFPPILYRVFDDLRWAQAFVEEGRMRLSRLEYFAEIEDPVRADRSEGSSSFQVPGDVTKVRMSPAGEILGVSQEPGHIHYSGELLNPVFVYCFCYPPEGNITLLPRKFGSHVVQIDDPRQLAQDVTDWLTSEGRLRGTPVVECRACVYNKGELAPEPANHMERTRLNYTQKPPQFADEHEYRFAVIATPAPGDDFPDHHEVNLGHRLSYAKLLD